MSESLYQILSFKLCPYGMKIPEIVNNYNICNETTAQLDEDFGGCVVKMRIPVKVGVIKDINFMDLKIIMVIQINYYMLQMYE